MKDIPVFTAENGLASLILSEISHSGRAYVLVRSVWTTAEALLAECRSFCVACGAGEVYASRGAEVLPGEPAWELLSMTCEKQRLPQPVRPVELVELDEENGPAYLEIYNQCFRDVPGAATYGNRDLQRMMEEATAYLARADGQYAGVAEISREGLEGIAVLPSYRGLGYNLALAVFEHIPSRIISLKVANTNVRARALYERLGFREAGVVSRWYRV